MSLPKFTHKRRFHKPTFGGTRALAVGLGTPESKQKCKETVALEVDEMKNARTDFSDSDLNDFGTGDTLPAPKHVGKSVEKWQTNRRLPSASGGLHASMKATGGTSKISSSAKRTLITNSPTLGVDTNNVQSADFTALSEKRKSLTLSNKVSSLEKGKSASTLGKELGEC